MSNEQMRAAFSIYKVRGFSRAGFWGTDDEFFKTKEDAEKRRLALIENGDLRAGDGKSEVFSIPVMTWQAAQQPQASEVEAVLVPREITKEMQHAYFDVIDKNLHDVSTKATFGRYDSQQEAYRAMLAAAPKARTTKAKPVMEDAAIREDAGYTGTTGETYGQCGTTSSTQAKREPDVEVVKKLRDACKPFAVGNEGYDGHAEANLSAAIALADEYLATLSQGNPAKDVKRVEWWQKQYQKLYEGGAEKLAEHGVIVDDFETHMKAIRYMEAATLDSSTKEPL